MLIKLDRSFFMYLPLMLSISFNVFAMPEDNGNPIRGQDTERNRQYYDNGEYYKIYGTGEVFECAPCERLNVIDKILGIDSESLVIDYESSEAYSLQNTEWYRKFVAEEVEDEDEDEENYPYEREKFIKRTIFGVIEKAIEANNKAITKNTSAIEANKTAITNNTNTINTNRIAITNNTNAINANRTVIENHEDRIQQLESRKLNLDKQINQLHRDIKSLDDRLASGIAASNAMAGLVSATKDGKSMIAVGLGTYRDRSAIAIGISKLSNDGRWKAKFSFATGMNGSNKDLSTSTSIGYQF
ncbi:YadA family autotransporter adhesin [Gallibacterium genomosp. 1]|uniref:YadA family autotransporter adhesin n=1 Tax=Gallibacterium genomosp. 1 TaxID=155515 RepID=UPI000802820B|nr:YadA-like family protein [Gallibacterium genomosp. 1]OBX00727.1 hypothetical protein QV04_05705 [Gallibacterium genomosp. 1]